MWLRIFLGFLLFGLTVETVLLVQAGTALAAKEETITLLKESQSLYRQQIAVYNRLEQKTDEVCEMQFKLGIAYRDVLFQMAEGLGLTKNRDNAWLALLTATGKALPKSTTY